MSSTNKTNKLGLNQWVKSDKPTMSDFNEDNQIIEKELLNKVAEPPVELPLSLVNGFIPRCGPCTFRKNQEGEVLINLSIEPTVYDNTIGRDTLVAMLPVGFTPTTNKYASCLSHKTDDTPCTSAIHVNSSGQVFADVFGGQAAAVFGQISFYTN